MTTKEQFYEQEIERCRRAYEAGHFPSLLEAAQLCIDNEHPLPLWAGRKLLEIANDAYNGNRRGPLADKGKRGRAASLKWTATEAKKKMMQHDRARHCLAMLDEKKTQLRALTRAQKDALRKDKRRARLLLLDGSHPMNVQGAFEWASKQLRGTPFQASPKVIKVAYRAVERAIKSGEDALLKAADDELT